MIFKTNYYVYLISLILSSMTLIHYIVIIKHVIRVQTINLYFTVNWLTGIFYCLCFTRPGAPSSVRDPSSIIDRFPIRTSFIRIVCEMFLRLDTSNVALFFFSKSERASYCKKKDKHSTSFNNVQQSGRK